MEKVIGGKLYNTETAELLHTWTNGYFQTDFNYCAESLYKTKKGAYFIAGEGGALSCYSNGDIFVSTEAEAMAWLEEHDEINPLQKYFSDKIEDA